jgi:hypothetical protein
MVSANADPIGLMPLPVEDFAESTGDRLVAHLDQPGKQYL